MPLPDLEKPAKFDEKDEHGPEASPVSSHTSAEQTNVSGHDVSSDLNGGDGALERIPTREDEADSPCAVRTTTTASTVGPVHSVFTKNQKRFIVMMASWAGFFSPVSASIYFPALNPLARDLRVSNSLINLTLTSYMIFQGLAPAFIGDLADAAGRRPAYMVCFVIYIAANLGLALQSSYPALFVLRCLQSSGSSGTIALSSGVVADVATAAERGAYMGFVTAGSLLGPALGPVIGGILSQFLGWRAIFWFLVIFAGSFLVTFAIFFPETARTAVGNGSIPPKGLNMSLMNYLAVRKAQKELGSQDMPSESLVTLPNRKNRFPNPLSSIHILADKENAILLAVNAFLFAAFYDVVATIPSQYAEIYGFNDFQNGLCYIPFGFGSMFAALSNGQLLDRNFRRWAKKFNVPLRKGRQTDLRNFPIEKARLQVAFPGLYFAAALILVYGWILDKKGPLAPLLVILFLSSYSMTVAFNVTSTLLVDFYPNSPATATAANNLCRCLLGAGATGVVQPMFNAMGRGWTFTFLSLFLVASSPLLWVVYFKGMNWREQRRIRDIAASEKTERKREAPVEEGRFSSDKDNTPPRKAASVGETTAITESACKSQGEGDVGGIFAADEGAEVQQGHFVHRSRSRDSVV